MRYLPSAFTTKYVSRGTFVPGEGPTPCDILIVGEGPGKDEDKWGRPFVGKSGKELNRYLWHSCQRTRTSVYVTNLVKYHVPGDGDPTPEDVARDSSILDAEIADTNPEVIVTLGRFSTRRFLGDVNMEVCHGVPRFVDDRCIFPIYHPAAGLHSTEFQALIYWDFEQLGKLLRGENVEWAAEDEVTKPDYRKLLYGANIVPGLAAVDTEGSTAKPWCLTWSQTPGMAACDRQGAQDFQHIVLHNAMHDIGVLRAMKVNYESFDDTMIMAYNLCVEPQGLKALALRHCGMEMNDYSELVAEPNRRYAIDYLVKALGVVCDSQLSSASSESSKTATRSRKPTRAKGGKKCVRTRPRAGKK